MFVALLEMTKKNRNQVIENDNLFAHFSKSIWYRGKKNKMMELLTDNCHGNRCWMLDFLGNF